jgi:hypothetical protein
VTLYRGVHGRADRIGSRLLVTLNPLSSWTTNLREAQRFGTETLKADVPWSRIFSVAGLGIGNFRHHEVVIFGPDIAVDVLDHHKPDFEVNIHSASLEEGEAFIDGPENWNWLHDASGGSLTRHYGPGPHPDGSPQKVHAGPDKQPDDVEIEDTPGAEPYTLEEAVTFWQSSFKASKSIREATLKKKPGLRAMALLKAIQEGTDGVMPAVFRGMSLPAKFDIEGTFKVGETIDLGLSAFSSEYGIASQFANGEESMRKMAVMIYLADGGQGVDLNKHGGQTGNIGIGPFGVFTGPRIQEWITGGRFRVTKVEFNPKTETSYADASIWLEQVGIFRVD